MTPAALRLIAQQMTEQQNQWIVWIGTDDTWMGLPSLAWADSHGLLLLEQPDTLAKWWIDIASIKAVIPNKKVD